MKKIVVLMMAVILATIGFNNEAKAATRVDLTSNYTWTNVNRPDVLKLRVIDSNDGDIIREMVWFDTLEDDSDPRMVCFQMATIMFCDGDIVELTNVTKDVTIKGTIKFHELYAEMIGNSYY